MDSNIFELNFNKNKSKLVILSIVLPPTHSPPGNSFHKKSVDSTPTLNPKETIDNRKCINER